MIFTPISVNSALPDRFTWPFDYEPHSLSILAAQKLQARLQVLCGPLKAEINQGKMFGVLVALRTDGTLGFLSAFSGQLGGSFVQDGFVPPIFDYLQPNGFFRLNERKISQLSLKIHEAENDAAYILLKRNWQALKSEHAKQLQLQRQKNLKAKQERDFKRSKGLLSPKEVGELIRESQFMKAETKRLKQRIALSESQMETELDTSERYIETLRKERRQRSDALQQWLFGHFKVCNALGEERSLNEIFAPTPQKIPPSGAGECCAPKLLHYAFTHNLRPVCMAEFWWGAPSYRDMRKPLCFYPSCQSKCGPILPFMLKGLPLDNNPQTELKEATIDIVYEDEWLVVVNKPAGLLSVPGRIRTLSALSQLQDMHPQDTFFPVHRLDQDTSGILVMAKSAEVYKNLQEQFARRDVKKTYVAILQHALSADKSLSGVINLPLSPHYEMRPRQRVDMERGKSATTLYNIIGSDGHGHPRILLHPQTGRTHQLRVHCAHPHGLDCPILGDALYGIRGERLFLHAERLTFTHPATGKRLCFKQEAPF